MSPEVAETKRLRYLNDRPAQEKALFIRRGKVMEMFFGEGLQISQIAEKMGISYTTILSDTEHYFKKPPETITLKSKV